MPLTRAVAGLALVAAIAVGAYLFFSGSGREAEPDAGGERAALVEILLPNSLSAPARSGKRLFDENCVTCHGPNAVGQAGLGPPLVHIIYEPGHHGDESFQRAVAIGVRRHHWPFDNMPPVEGLSREDVALIVAYIRELQRANGIN